MINRQQISFYGKTDNILDLVRSCCEPQPDSSTKLDRNYMPSLINISNVTYPQSNFHDFLKVCMIKLHDEHPNDYKALREMKTKYQGAYLTYWDGHEKLRAAFEAIEIKGISLVKGEVNGFLKTLASNFKALNALGQVYMRDYVNVPNPAHITNPNNPGAVGNTPPTLRQMIDVNGTPVSIAGLKVCVTGVVQGLSRKEIQNVIEQAGGIFATSVTNTTDLLIVGDKPGSTKIADAKAKGVTMLNENQFLRII